MFTLLGRERAEQIAVDQALEVFDDAEGEGAVAGEQTQFDVVVEDSAREVRGRDEPSGDARFPYRSTARREPNPLNEDSGCMSFAVSLHDRNDHAVPAMPSKRFTLRIIEARGSG